MIGSYRKHKEIQIEDVIVSYAGALNMDIVSSVMNLSEVTLLAQAIKLKQRKSLINIVIEGLQNVLHHTIEDSNFNGQHRDCLVMIGKEDAHLCVYIGNYIKATHIPILRQKLESLQAMTSEELHRYYLETLDKDTFPTKGGAGLGWIRIFLDSNRAVSYHFEKVNEQYSFFGFTAKVLG